MNRRNFLQTSATATTGMLLALDAISSAAKPTFLSDKNFELKLLQTNWGFNGSVDEYCAKVKKEGYDGIEIWWPGEQKDQDEVFGALKKYGLEVGFLTAGYQSDYTQHLDAFKKMVDAAANNKIQRPLYINCHS